MPRSAARPVSIFVPARTSLELSGSPVASSVIRPLGHALEIATHFSLAHGEGVAIGLKFAALVARALGRIDDARVAYHDDVIVREYGLDASVPPGLVSSELIDLMERDKKSSGGLTFMLDGTHGIEMVRDVPEEIVLDCLRLMEVR